MTSTRNIADGLWDTPLTKPTSSTARELNIIIPKQQNISNPLQYLHASLYSPPKSTLLRAIENVNLATWHGLTYSNVLKYLPDMHVTVLGHLE